MRLLPFAVLVLSRAVTAGAQASDPPTTASGARVNAARAVSLAGGYGLLGGREVAGPGPTIQATVRVLPPRGRAQLRAELHYQRATADGNPLQCRQVEMFSCLGRTDRMSAAGVALAGHFDAVLARRARLYVPLAVGIDRIRTRSSETEGPTGQCVSNGQLGPCPDDPPFRTVSRSRLHYQGAVSWGLGLSFPLGRTSAFIEARLRAVGGVSDPSASMLPVLVGLAF